MLRADLDLAGTDHWNTDDFGTVVFESNFAPASPDAQVRA